MKKVTFDTEEIAQSGVIERNGAAQIIITWLNPIVGELVRINGINYGSSTAFIINGWQEPINCGEYSTTQINIVLGAAMKVAVTRKYYES